MKLAIHSDLHLEFSDVDIHNTQNCETLILSGDILISDVLRSFPADYEPFPIVSNRHAQSIRFRNFLSRCSDNFQNVIYVAGNHEFYHGKFYETLDILKNECANYSNLHFLEDSSVTIDDVIFVGGTLWTNCNNKDPLTMYQLSKLMNDFNIIRNERNSFRKLNTTDIVERFNTTLKYIEVVAANAPKDKKVVMVVHHAPCAYSIHEDYKDDFIMNGGYFSNLDEFILNNPNIVLVTHGHVHHSFDYNIGTTRVVCNPRGYASSEYAEITDWNPNLTVEI